MSGPYPDCGYKIYKGRCFNCDYEERGSDGPWDAGATDQVLIRKARDIWDGGIPFTHEDAFKIEYVIRYLKQRRIFELASKCDQLIGHISLHRIIKIRSGSVLLGRVWHVQKGFLGVHITRIEWIGGDKPYQRDERQTIGACRGGAVWFGTVTPDTILVVGEGIETVLSAMVLWGAKAGAATLGTSGLRSLVLPAAARKVVIAADNDAPAYKGRKKLPNGMDAARAGRRLWLDEDPSVDVEIRLAPAPRLGEDKRDWNDVLMELENV
jgi:hypothetical protein